jgi:uncharacterized membrane protein YjjB (DUF3815 family)
MDYFAFFEKWIWLGAAAAGFAVLFNVPQRTIWVIILMGALGGAVKLLTIEMGGSIIIGSFLGAVLIGFISIIAAHQTHTPPFVLAIPSVIPMVPGAFAYRMMLGLFRLTGEVTDQTVFLKLLQDTVDNGLKALFVLMVLSLGVSAPMLLTRIDSVKNIKVKVNVSRRIFRKSISRKK